MNKKGIMKKGQISVIIAIGVAVLIIAIAISFLGSSSAEKKVRTEVQKAVVKDHRPVMYYAEKTVENSAVNSIINLGEWGGGDFSAGEETRAGSDERVAYGLKSTENPNHNKIPSISVLESNLESYVVEEIKEKLKFEQFIKEGYEITQPSDGEIIADAKILDDKIVFDISYPMAIKSGGLEYSNNKFHIEVASRLKRIIEHANNLIGEINTYYHEHKDDPEEERTLMSLAEFDFSCDLNMIQAKYEEEVEDSRTKRFIRFKHYDYIGIAWGYDFQFAVEGAYIYNTGPQRATRMDGVLCPA